MTNLVMISILVIAYHIFTKILNFKFGEGCLAFLSLLHLVFYSTYIEKF